MRKNRSIMVAFLAGLMVTASMTGCSNKEAATETTVAVMTETESESEKIAVDVESMAQSEAEDKMLEEVNGVATDSTVAENDESEMTAEEETISKEDMADEKEESEQAQSNAEAMVKELEGVTDEAERQAIIDSYTVKLTGTVKAVAENEDGMKEYTVETAERGEVVFVAGEDTEASDKVVEGAEVTVGFDGATTKSIPAKATGVYWIRTADEVAEVEAKEEAAVAEADKKEAAAEDGAAVNTDKTVETEETAE